MNTVLVPGSSDAPFLRNPYPTYQALRDAGPLHWSEEFFGGAWLLTRHTDVEAVLRDPRFSAQRTGGWINDVELQRGEFSRFQHLFSRALLFLDAPEHTRVRGLMQPAFRPDALALLRPRIEHIADTLLDAIDPDASFDFMASVARVLPVRVISMLLLGTAQANSEDLLRWSDDLAAFIGAPQPTRALAQRAQTGVLALTRFFARKLDEPDDAEPPALLGVLRQARSRGALKDDAELLAQCAMLLFAGHETTRNLLGNGLLALLTHPDQWQALLDDPERTPGAVRELLRYDSPVQYSGRRVTTALTLHGRQLKRGDLVLPLIGAANRDPSRHPDPDRLDILRPDPGSLSFGSGMHTCLGAALTRLEADIVLRRLLPRWPRLRLALQPQHLQWSANPAYRGLRALPLLAC
ncbi:cytochrome P450 [Thiomonas intermedia]|uniref:cytochrome P450 n=1 Tax=Thiomonas intermedia TaxID=926 RepID=UPI0009A4B41F|nr:cytochrome P450 [Thiomonas intermedia]